jgi:CheY-like chemotaxis protein
MNELTGTSVRVLIVEPDAGLRSFLSDLLSEEGYTAVSVHSPQEGLDQLDRQVFQLVLLRLFAGHLFYSVAAAQVILRWARPTPVGLLTTESAPTPTPPGFAFTLSLPFALEDLLTAVAAALHPSLTRGQQRQVETVARFFHALNAQEWEGLDSLCTDEVLWSPPRERPLSRRGMRSGIAALVAFLQEEARLAGLGAYSDLALFVRPNGLAARYRHWWLPTTGLARTQLGTALFRFQAELISQIRLSYRPGWPLESTSPD